MSPEEGSRADAKAERNVQEPLRALDLFDLERRRQRADLMPLCSFLRRGCGEGCAELFYLGSSNRDMGMVQSYARGGSDWTLGSVSLTGGG